PPPTGAASGASGSTRRRQRRGWSSGPLFLYGSFPGAAAKVPRSPTTLPEALLLVPHSVQVVKVGGPESTAGLESNRLSDRPPRGSWRSSRCHRSEERRGGRVCRLL